MSHAPDHAPAPDPTPAAPAGTAPAGAAYAHPSHRPRRPLGRNGRLTWLQLICGIVVFIAAQLVMGFTAGLVSILRDPSATLTESSVSLSSLDPWGMLAGMVLGAAVAVGGYLLIVGPIGGRPGLALRGRGKLAELGVGLLIGAVLISVSFWLITALGGYRVVGVDPHPELLTPLAIGIGAAFMEETLFRGTIQRLLDGWLGSWAALAITALLFGLAHFTNPGAGLVGAIAIVIEAGILLGGAYLLTRRLWLAIGIHLAWNAVQSGVYSSSVSGTGEQHGLLRVANAGPEWLTGGSMGIEGSYVTILVGLTAGIVMLVLAHRRGNLWGRDRRPKPRS